MARYNTSKSLRTWANAEDWHERVITFDPSWFVLIMGTGKEI
jgi:hypothetical protein